VAIIQWCLQSIEEAEKADPQTRELVRKALIQANAMSHLVTDMLHVFRLEKRRESSQSYQPVDLGKVLEQALAQVQALAANKKIKIARGPQETMRPVLADEGYLRQAVINLIDNAIKYSEAGDVVTVSLEEKAGKAEFSVKDQGIGISDAEQQRLFTEFFRGAEAQEHAHEGTGLGLVLVKHIVEEFGGEIKVKSEAGKGSTFTVVLPLAR
jgi:signal transduction histidine kinase